MKMNKYSTEDVCRLIGMPLSTLKYLLYYTKFKPTWPSEGKRQRNYYSDEDLKALKRYQDAGSWQPKYSLLEGEK
jgi:hypothetical protein